VEQEETDKEEEGEEEEGRRRRKRRSRRIGCQLLAMFGILRITPLCHNDPNSSIIQ
jgi:hypothetical protein